MKKLLITGAIAAAFSVFSEAVGQRAEKPLKTARTVGAGAKRATAPLNKTREKARRLRQLSSGAGQ